MLTMKLQTWSRLEGVHCPKQLDYYISCELTSANMESVCLCLH